MDLENLQNEMEQQEILKNRLQKKQESKTRCLTRTKLSAFAYAYIDDQSLDSLDSNTISEIIDVAWKLKPPTAEQKRQKQLEQKEEHIKVLMERKAKCDENTLNEVEKLNERNMYCLADNTIYTQIITHDQRRRLLGKQIQHFLTQHSNRKLETGVTPTGIPKFTPLGKAWIQSPDRQEIDDIIMDPTKKKWQIITVGTPERKYWNSWAGFSVEPKQGDIPLFEHLVDHVICGSESALSEYLWQWLARLIQKPEALAHSIPILTGAEGTGKGTFVQSIGKLFDPSHYVVKEKAQNITGQFNADWENAILLYANESFFAGDTKAANVLKALATEEYREVEEKYKSARMARNYTKLILSTNNTRSIEANAGSRRWVCLEVSPKYARDSSYFQSLAQEYDSHGKAALLHKLMNMDISNFNTYDIPMSDALQNQQVLSLEGNPYAQWLYNALSSGSMIIAPNSPNYNPDFDSRIEPATDFGSEVAVHSLFTDMINYTKSTSSSGYKTVKDAAGFSKFLGSVFGQALKRGRCSTRRTVTLPSLGAAKELFQRHMKWDKHKWN